MRIRRILSESQPVTTTSSFAFNRRDILRSSAGLAAGSVLAAPLKSFAASQQENGTFVSLGNSPYGPLAPVADQSTGLPLLQLPKDFQYTCFGWSGDLMSNGQPTPPRHDGMAVVRGGGRNGRGVFLLTRNHENAITFDLEGRPYGNIRSSEIYDDVVIPDGVPGIEAGPLSGGTTTLLVVNGEVRQAVPSLGGTVANCAGGPTPWGTWLTCEETLADGRPLGGLKHGYVFEVTYPRMDGNARPLVGMGRFSHEAVCVDPVTSTVYLTEDSRNTAGFYRYVPEDRVRKAGGYAATGGALYAAKVIGQPGADINAPRIGDSYPIEWVLIEEPDADPQPFSDDIVEGVASGVFVQARQKGGLRMSRGEGCWWSDREDKVYFVDTGAGLSSDGRPGRGEGAVWAYDVLSSTLTCIYASGSRLAGNNPDNITVNRRGGILLCEDGGGVEDEFGFGERLLGLGHDGVPYAFAKNNIVLEPSDIARAGKSTAFIEAEDHRGREWCGATFDRSAGTLFVNVQTPGITFAIWGPWRRGTL
jgi:secreted PhoX family phosphatase